MAKLGAAKPKAIKIGAAKTAAKKVAAKKPSAQQQWLQKDPAYLEQQSQANAAFERFKTGQKLNLGQFQTTYNRNKEDIATGRAQTLKDTNESFAARGMANAGVFNTAREDVNKNFARQQTALDTGLSNFKQDQGYELTNASSQKADVIKRALRDATERYAQRQYLI